MDATVIRTRALSALIVGASGINVLRIVSAFEARRIVTLRTDTIAAACERVVIDMPHVILTLVPPASASEADALEERALAVGAFVVKVAPDLDDTVLRQVLETTIQTALERKLLKEAEDAQAARVAAGTTDLTHEIDDGWND